MASLFQLHRKDVRILDPGAGTGLLTVALAERLATSDLRPRSVHAVCYEVEKAFLPFLEENLEMCAGDCSKTGLTFTFEIREHDFLQSAASLLECSVFGLPPVEQFDLAILNPPYKKIGTASRERRLMRSIGLETVNLYTGFMAAAAALLNEGGEFVAITPRSFCNGPYYKCFRKYFFEHMTLKHLHIFETRNTAFKDDSVLQETIITFAARDVPTSEVCVSSGDSPGSPFHACMTVQHDAVVSPEDDDLFVRLVANKEQEEVGKRIARFKHKLGQLGLVVSTGRVVDFRSREHLLKDFREGAAPLVYPVHFQGWGVSWPARNCRKPNAIAVCKETQSMLLPPGHYVLTKRFSAKEEARRVVAVVYDAKEVAPLPVAFENHINYFHAGGSGLDEELAWGLAAYMNSHVVDSYFRTFNGHTQVNATDLRSLPYPSARQLRCLGAYARARRPDAGQIDAFLFHEIGES